MFKITKDNVNDILSKAAKIGGIIIIGGVVYHIGKIAGGVEVIQMLEKMAVEDKDTVFISDTEFNYIVNAVPKGIAD